MIEAIDLSKRYADGTLALDALNLKVEPGEIYCLLGAHGAGKSTVLNLFLNFTPPTAGRVLINGLDATRQAREAKKHVAFLSAEMALFGSLTAIQNLEFFARVGGRFDRRRADYAMALREVGLPERYFDRRVESFSKGMRQKLGIATGLIKGAPAILLDEPLSGIDAQTAAELVEILKGLREAGKAILLSTHDLFYAKQLADQIGILKEGRKVLACSREELRYQDLESLYLNYMRGGVELG